MLKLSNSLLHYKWEDDDDDGTYKMDVIRYSNKVFTYYNFVYLL